MDEARQSEAVRRHVLQPIPSLANPIQPESKEERLKVIISNIEKHHQRARASILQHTQQQLQTSLTAVSATDAMDIDIAPQELATAMSNLNAPYVQGTLEATKLLEAYNTCADGTKDYYVKALNRHSAGRGSNAGMNGVSSDPRRGR